MEINNECNLNDSDEINKDEESEEIESINLIDMDNKKPKSNNKSIIKGTPRTGYSGEGKAKLIEQENKQLVISDRLKYEELVYNREQSLLKTVEFKKMCRKKLRLKEIENNITVNFYLPLNSAQIGSVPIKNSEKLQYLNLNHKGNDTFLLIKRFLPQYEVSIDVVQKKNSDSIYLARMTLTSLINCEEKHQYFSALGKEDNVIGAAQGQLSYVMKFTNIFKFLKPINFPPYEGNKILLENVMNTMEKFKNAFNYIDMDYKFYFDFALDHIAYFYFSRGLLPPLQFNCALLLQLFNPERLYNDDELFTQSCCKEITRSTLEKWCGEETLKKFNQDLYKDENDNKVVFIKKIPKDLFTLIDVISERTLVFYNQGYLPQGIIYKSLEESKALGNNQSNNQDGNGNDDDGNNNYDDGDDGLFGH